MLVSLKSPSWRLASHTSFTTAHPQLSVTHIRRRGNHICRPTSAPQWEEACVVFCSKFNCSSRLLPPVLSFLQVYWEMLLSNKVHCLHLSALTHLVLVWASRCLLEPLQGNMSSSAIICFIYKSSKCTAYFISNSCVKYILLMPLFVFLL